MADVKISQLPAATTPVDGTEVLPIVQSATTKQVSIANLTAGRAVSALSLSLTNALPVTSGGTGINAAAQGSLLSATGTNTFSATTTPTLGLAGTAAGTLGLSGSSSGVVTLATAATAGTWTLTLPTTGGTNNYILTTNGSGVTTWTNPTALGVDLDVGTTAITGGTTTRVLYNNAGVLGEYSAVPVGVGGTGTSTAFTAGSVVFAGASGTYSQDNANFFWDDSNNRLGIGTATPSYDIQTQKAGVTSNYIYNSTDAVGLRLIAYTNAAYIQTQTNHPLLFATNNSAASLTLDTSGNLGLGVTPSAWSASTKSFQFGLFGSLNGRTPGSGTYLSDNVYFSGDPSNTAANGVRIGATLATTYMQSGGVHAWYNAGSSTAGSAISFTQAMTLDANGQLGIGSPTPAATLDVLAASATQRLYSTTGTNTVYTQYRNTGGLGYVGLDTSTGGAFGGAAYALSIYHSGAYPIIMFTSGTERARIDASGNLLVNAQTTTGNGNFTNYNRSAVLTNGGSSLNRTFNITNDTTPISNTTVDVLRLLDAAGNVIGANAISGIVSIFARGSSGANAYTASFTLNATGNGVTNASLTLLNTAQTRGTSPVSSVQIAADGGTGSVKVTITYINNALVNSGLCSATFTGVISL